MPIEDAVDIAGCGPPMDERIKTIGNQAAAGSEEADRIDRGKSAGPALLFHSRCAPVTWHAGDPVVDFAYTGNPSDYLFRLVPEAPAGRRAHKGHFASGGRHRDAGGGHYDTDVLGESRVDFCLQQLVGESRPRRLGILKRWVPRELANCLNAGVDRHPVSVQYDVVEECIVSISNAARIVFA